MRPLMQGSANQQNLRYWSDENPHWMQEFHTQHPPKINAWTDFVAN